MLISIVSFVIVFTIVALVHELGHFIVAKKNGILVYEFALGFGPRLFSVRRGETDYSINLIPILAYVKIAGEDEDGDSPCPDDRKYYSKSPLVKFT
ncbi:MAG TPA: site-2 protease family protein, partial [Candidatus Omnitrophota bacterium]|nr:site-2 protease family protein [Candidatus Omnitrophota bacterium]